jgi:hypothetical protein
MARAKKQQENASQEAVSPLGTSISQQINTVSGIIANLSKGLNKDLLSGDESVSTIKIELKGVPATALASLIEDVSPSNSEGAILEFNVDDLSKIKTRAENVLQGVVDKCPDNYENIKSIVFNVLRSSLTIVALGEAQQEQPKQTGKKTGRQPKVNGEGSAPKTANGNNETEENAAPAAKPKGKPKKEEAVAEPEPKAEAQETEAAKPSKSRGRPAKENKTNDEKKEKEAEAKDKEEPSARPQRKRNVPNYAELDSAGTAGSKKNADKKDNKDEAGTSGTNENEQPKADEKADDEAESEQAPVQSKRGRRGGKK